MKTVCITGNIASGKSLVTDYLIKKKYTVLCADKIYHKLLSTNNILQKKIVEHFGNYILDNNKINTQLLSYIVLNNKTQLNILNEISHPFVIKKIESELNKFKNKSFVFLSVPLVFEINYEKKFDYIVTVYSFLYQQIQRLIKRNNLTVSQCLKRIYIQLPISYKTKNSDFVLKNTDTKEFLYKQIDNMLYKIYN